jgi:serine/threonine protein phosphatase PrpC
MDGRDSQDRAAVREEADGSLRIVLADGVGGQSGGLQAAQKAVDEWLQSGYAPELALAETDSLLSRHPSGGLTTAIYLRLSAEELIGASVGDSKCWFQEANARWTELTEHQRLRPFLGSGEAIPIPFSRVTRPSGRLILCSDGLWRQTALDRIFELAAREDADELLLAPRLPVSKSYSDDVSFVLVGWDSSRR